MRTRSERPSPDMSARNTDWVGSEKTSRGPVSSSQLFGERPAGPKPFFVSDSYHVKTVSSDIRISGCPSPVISTKRRLGSLVLIFGTDLNRVYLPQPPSAVRSW